MKIKFFVFFVMTFVSFQAFGQGFYLFRYRISTDTIPNRYLITYTETDTTEGAMPDSIKIGVIVILQAKTCKFCSNSQIAGSNFG